MELKVWVEGIQRVVCGITEQTTVQEVVIALAQATGRTGRYTLVEKWRDNEKLLPPSEHPIKVLEKWGEYASDVQFLLKRTGASTTSSDVENSKPPERNVYRQSLPPLAKTREKNEILQLKRKEPKRKSLTITGGGTNAKQNDDAKEKRYQNSNGNNNRDHDVSARYDRTASGSVPANVRKAAQRFSANRSTEEPPGASSKSSRGKEKTKSKGKSDRKSKEEVKPAVKTALLPPHMQSQRSGNTVGSATKALFPSEPISQVEAKSPTRKNDQIKNVNTKSSGKVPLMPPTHKALRGRNLSSTSSQHPDVTPSHTSTDKSNNRNSTSGAVTPTPFSLPNDNDNSVRSYPRRYGNSLPRSGKKVWSGANSASVDDSRRHPREVTKKTALMPPGQRQRAMTPNPQIHFESYTPAPISLASNNYEEVKAKDDFTKLVREQQQHIDEQKQTVSALDKEIKALLDKMQQQEKDVDAEIAQLEEQNRLLEMQNSMGYNVAQELSAQESEVNRTQQEMTNLQREIEKSSANINGYKRKMDDLTKAISEETHLQRIKQQRAAESSRNTVIKNRKDIEHVNWKLSSLEEEIKNIEKEISYRDEDITTKHSSLDILNRELRQVNLQQFIRKTGSKVTVLPPETESEDKRRISRNFDSPSPSSNIAGSRSPLSPTHSGNSEGVWV